MKHRNKIQNEYIMPHSIFLTMVIGTSEEISKIMRGCFTLKSVIGEKEISKLLDSVPPKYKVNSLSDAIRTGGYVNYTLSFIITILIHILLHVAIHIKSFMSFQVT